MMYIVNGAGTVIMQRTRVKDMAGLRTVSLVICGVSTLTSIPGRIYRHHKHTSCHLQAYLQLSGHYRTCVGHTHCNDYHWSPLIICKLWAKSYLYKCSFKLLQLRTCLPLWVVTFIGVHFLLGLWIPPPPKKKIGLQFKSWVDFACSLRVCFLRVLPFNPTVQKYAH